MKRFLFGFSALCVIAVSCSKNNPSPTLPVNSNTGGNTGTGSQPTLSVTGFSPKSAQPGTKITITGTGFGSDVSKVKVAVGNSPYDKPVSVTPTSIIIQTNLATPSGKISVLIGNDKAISASDFTALLPTLTVVGFNVFSPIQLGHDLTIYAQGFGDDTNKIAVSFGGTKAVKPNYLADDRLALTVMVPRYAKQGKVTVSFNGQIATSPDDLIFGLSIADFTPKTFSQGDTVTITGFAFTNGNDMSINLNTTTNTVLRPFKVTPTIMQMVVPFNATSGYLGISANAGVDEDLDADIKYTFIPTVYFTNVFTPSSGKVGDIIRINGDFTGADISTIGVSFGGSNPVRPSTIIGPDIYVKVPVDAKTGKITISRTGYKSLTGNFTFTVTP